MANMIASSFSRHIEHRFFEPPTGASWPLDPIEEAIIREFACLSSFPHFILCGKVHGRLFALNDGLFATSRGGNKTPPVTWRPIPLEVTRS